MQLDSAVRATLTRLQRQDAGKLHAALTHVHAEQAGALEALVKESGLDAATLRAVATRRGLK